MVDCSEVLALAKVPQALLQLCTFSVSFSPIVQCVETHVLTLISFFVLTSKGS